MAKKLLEAIREPFVINKHQLLITTSIGIIIYPKDGEDAETLIKNANIAMYRAKEGDRDRYERYKPGYCRPAVGGQVCYYNRYAEKGIPMQSRYPFLSLV